MNLIRRPRRNRQSAVIRDMVQETRLSVTDFILPVFITEGQNVRSEVSSMPGIYRYSLDLLLNEIEECVDLGVKTFDLFPNIAESKKISTLPKVTTPMVCTSRRFGPSKTVFLR